MRRLIDKFLRWMPPWLVRLLLLPKILTVIRPRVEWYQEQTSVLRPSIYVRQQGWMRVRNVWSPVHAGCRCVAVGRQRKITPSPTLGKEPRMQATLPLKGEGGVYIGVDETAEVRAGTAVLKRSDGAFEVIGVDWQIGGLECDKVVFDDPLGPTGSACGDDDDLCEWSQKNRDEILSWNHTARKICEMLETQYPTTRLMEYIVEEIQNELRARTMEVGDVGKQG